MINTKQIVITGPESSGKTSLATYLATYYNAPLVPEYAREYLTNLGRPYRYGDLETMARGQLRLIAEQLAGEPPLIIIDTHLIVILIWSKYRFGKSPEWIHKRLTEQLPDLFLLCYPDVPWTPDPLRENPDDRESLHDLYLETLNAIGSAFQEIRGSSSERQALAVKAIDALF